MPRIPTNRLVSRKLRPQQETELVPDATDDSEILVKLTADINNMNRKQPIYIRLRDRRVTHHFGSDGFGNTSLRSKRFGDKFRFSPQLSHRLRKH